MKKYLIIEGKRIRRDKFISDNQSLVNFAIKKYFNWTEGVKHRNNKYGTNIFTYEDIVQEGTIGLIEAADNYKDNKGAKFSSFAMNYIITKITNALMTKGFGLIRMPRSMYDAKKRIDAICAKEKKTYSELFEDKTISRRMYHSILALVNCRNYEVIDNEGNEPEDNRLREYLSTYEDKDRALKLLMTSTKAAYKQDIKRNYYIMLLRFGLNGSSEERTYLDISNIIKKKFKSECGKQRVKNIIGRILQEAKVIYQKEIANDTIGCNN